MAELVRHNGLPGAILVKRITIFELAKQGLLDPLKLELKESGLTLNINTKDGTSLLAVAVGAGQEVVARFLVEEKGATLNVFNRANQTELDACKLSSLSAYLKSKGALTGKSALDSSFLFASIMSGNISQITMLLEKNEELREQLAT